MTNRFVILSLTALTTPHGPPSEQTSMEHVTALAMLVLEQVEQGWRVDLRAHAIGAGDGEDVLLAWAMTNLPETGIAVGWRLAEAIVRPLIEAARDCDPEIAPPFLDRLIALLGGPSVDLALGHGGSAAPAMDVIAAAQGITALTLSPAEVETAWSFGDTARLKRHTRAQVIAATRLWLAEAPGDRFPAKEAFTRWLCGDGEVIDLPTTRP